MVETLEKEVSPCYDCGPVIDFGMFEIGQKPKRSGAHDLAVVDLTRFELSWKKKLLVGLPAYGALQVAEFLGAYTIIKKAFEYLF